MMIIMTGLNSGKNEFVLALKNLIPDFQDRIQLAEIVLTMKTDKTGKKKSEILIVETTIIKHLELFDSQNKESTYG